MSKKYEAESRIIRVKLVDGTKINGQVNIKNGAGHDRLSDLVRDTTEIFLVVSRAQVYEDGLDNPARIPTIFINKNHILWATPDDTQA